MKAFAVAILIFAWAAVLIWDMNLAEVTKSRDAWRNGYKEHMRMYHPDIATNEFWK